MTNHIYNCNLGTCGNWCLRGDSPASARGGVLRANYFKVVKFDVLFREAVKYYLGGMDGEVFFSRDKVKNLHGGTGRGQGGEHTA